MVDKENSAHKLQDFKMLVNQTSASLKLQLKGLLCLMKRIQGDQTKSKWKIFLIPLNNLRKSENTNIDLKKAQTLKTKHSSLYKKRE